jgi:hypothetical protein
VLVLVVTLGREMSYDRFSGKTSVCWEKSRM